MQLVAEHYCTSDGRVNYRKFCDLMEHGKVAHYLLMLILISATVHNVPQLEKKPTELVQRPPRGHLLQVYCIAIQYIRSHDQAMLL